MYEDSTAGHPHASEEDILALLCQSKAYPSDTPVENALLKEVGTDIHNDGSLISLDVVTGLGAPFGRAPADSVYVDAYLRQWCLQNQDPWNYMPQRCYCIRLAIAVVLTMLAFGLACCLAPIR
jgi:hypothetical protein